MKKIILCLLCISFQSQADLISFDCHEEISRDLYDQYMEDGSPEFDTGDYYQSGNDGAGEFLLFLNDSLIEGTTSRMNWSQGVFTVKKMLGPSPMAAGRRYVFSMDHELEFFGKLEIYEVGGFAGNVLSKTLNCLVSED